MKIREKFRTSAALLHSPYALAITAMLVAINLAMDLLGLRIQLTPTLRIGVGFLTSAMVGMLCGPVMGMMSGVATDVLGWLCNSGGGAYFPGFTVTAVLAGLIWGLWLFNDKAPKFWHCLGARLCITMLLNLGLNSVWKAIYFGKGYTAAALLASAGKNLILLVPETLLLYATARLVYGVYSRYGRPVTRR